MLNAAATLRNEKALLLGGHADRRPDHHDDVEENVP
jgi:hypothetical protein